MKRYLFVVLAIVFIVACMVVPAFAAESISAIAFAEDYALLPSVVPSGYYTLTLYMNAGTVHGLTLVTEPFFCWSVC